MSMESKDPRHPLLAVLLLPILFLLPFLLWGQEGSTVNQTPGPPNVPYQILLFYSGSNLEYICLGRSENSTTSAAISSATAANPGVFTSTGHGFFTTSAIATPVISISGATGSWVPANGTWIMLPIDANTFNIRNRTTGVALDTTGFGALTGTVTLSSRAPRTNQYQWSISKLTYDGSSNLTGKFWAYSASGGGYNRNRCDDRAAASTEYR